MSIQSICQEAKRFPRDKKGNFAGLFAVTAMFTFVAGGVLVDGTRAWHQRSALNDALDASVLGTARAISLGKVQLKDAKVYLKRLMDGNLGNSMDNPASIHIKDIKFNSATETLTASAAMTYKTNFDFFGAMNSFPISTKSAASYGGTHAEIAMTFDTTGSMRGRKIQDLKKAAKAGIDILLAANAGGVDRVRIAAVPYADAVNVGTLSKFVYPDSGNSNDSPPKLPKKNDPILVSAGSVGDNCATERKGSLQFSDNGPQDGMVNRDARLKLCPKAELVPLTANKSKLNKSINDIQANGYTAGHIGIQWAWYTLSQKWASVMPKGSGASSKSAKIAKYAIIMTDGEFNTAFAGVGKNSQTRGRQGTKSAEYAVQLCKNMKADGIEVFTIGFQLKNRRALNTMASCASPARDGLTFYHEASTGAELTNTYKEIAAMIQTLRLTQ